MRLSQGIRYTMIWIELVYEDISRLGHLAHTSEVVEGVRGKPYFAGLENFVISEPSSLAPRRWQSHYGDARSDHVL